MEQKYKDSAKTGKQSATPRKGWQVLGNGRKNLEGCIITPPKRRLPEKVIILTLALLVLLVPGNFSYGQDANDAMFIDKDGNVGIGTSASKANLDVSGTIKASEFTNNDGVSLSRVQTTAANIAKDVQDAQKDISALNLQVPVGTIMAYGGDTTSVDVVDRLRQKGWLPCSGIVVSRDEYKDLYDVIGAAFGSNSDTTFQVPDMRGQFLRGVDQGSKRDPDAGLRQASAPNGNTGDKVGSVQEDQLKTHKHAVKAAHAGYAGGSSTGDPIAVAGWSRNPANKEVEAAGGAETRSKNISVNWIIKAKHMLPLKP